MNFDRQAAQRPSPGVARDLGREPIPGLAGTQRQVYLDGAGAGEQPRGGRQGAGQGAGRERPG